MAHSNEFIEYLLELLQGTGGEVTARKMFGGYGLYYNQGLESIMFALVANDVLYLKTDAENLADFEQRKLAAFQYERTGKTYSMSYNEAPGEALDDPDEMTFWAGKAIDAARRCATRKTTR